MYAEAEMMTPFPDALRVEAAGRCNFRCRHCPIQNLRGLLAYDDFVTILDRMPRVPRMLMLNHGGEPMLNRDLEHIVAYARDKGVRIVTLNTNASLIRPIPGLTEMYVSFDGETPDENDFIRIGSNFRKHAAKVKEVAKKQKVTIYNVQATGGEKPKVAKYLVDYFGTSVRYETEAMRLWAGHEQFAGSEIVAHPVRPTYCASMFGGFHVMSNGDVVKCCEDLNAEYVYGNVLQEEPLVIWERMQIIRDNFANRIYPEQCQKCWVVAGIFYARGKK